MQVNRLLDIADPTEDGALPNNLRVTTRNTGAFNTCAATPSATDCVATALLDTYFIEPLVIGPAVGINTLTGFDDGLMVNPGAFREIANGPLSATMPVDAANAALSVQDFNVFRKRVALAINTLDDKITEILNTPRPGC